jgi:rhodanese-related sulfurtransferase
MIDHLRPSQLPSWFKAASNDATAVVLDVREPWELQTAAVKPDGFALVTIPMGEIPTRLKELAPDQAIACLCHHGARSLRVASYLAQNGFTKVANISGGIAAWADELDTTIAQY